MLIEGHEIKITQLGRHMLGGIYEISVKTPSSVVFGRRVQHPVPISEFQAYQYFIKSYKDFWIEASTIEERVQTATASIVMEELKQ